MKLVSYDIQYDNGVSSTVDRVSRESNSIQYLRKLEDGLMSEVLCLLPRLLQ